MSVKFQYKEALMAASALCSRTEKCVSDITEKFKEWGLSVEEIEQGIQFLIKEKFIDEQRFANNFVHDKLLLNKWGKIKIAYYLRMKEIPEPVISAALETIREADYTRTLTDILRSKINYIKGNSDWERKAKLVEFARGRGFETEEAMRIADEVLGK